MKRVPIVLVALLGALVPCCPDGYGYRPPLTHAGWGMGCMPAVAGNALMSQPLMPLAGPPVLHWQDLGDSERGPQWALFRGPVQIGVYLTDDDEYRVKLAPGQFAEESSVPPIDPPVAAKKKCGCSSKCACKAKGKGKCGCTKDKKCNPDCKCGIKVIGRPEGASGCACPCTGGDECHCPLDAPCGPDCCKNYGVAMEKIGDRERYTINGREVQAQEGLGELGLGQRPPSRPHPQPRQPDQPSPRPELPDDSAKLSFTVISDDPKVLEAAKADMQRPEMAEFRKHVVEQYYDLNGPEKAMLACGFIDKGTQVIVQTKDGGVVWDDFGGYRGIATLLATAHSAEVRKEIRKQHPDYDRQNDPGPHNPPRPAKPNAPQPSPDGSSGISLGAIAAWIIGGLLALACPLLALGIFVLFIVLLVRKKRS